MQRKLTLTLATSMMMFPQVVETIYSPALTHIADGLRVSAEMAAQTLSCYFLAFALGVVVWGRKPRSVTVSTVMSWRGCSR